MRRCRSQKNISEKKGFFAEMEPFEDPDWMIRGIKEEQYDIYIMDIRMEKNGRHRGREKNPCGISGADHHICDQLSGSTRSTRMK